MLKKLLTNKTFIIICIILFVVLVVVSIVFNNQLGKLISYGMGAVITWSIAKKGMDNIESKINEAKYTKRSLHDEVKNNNTDDNYTFAARFIARRRNKHNKR